VVWHIKVSELHEYFYLIDGTYLLELMNI